MPKQRKTTKEVAQAARFAKQTAKKHPPKLQKPVKLLLRQLLKLKKQG